jgi:toxin ParE1/3/4
MATFRLSKMAERDIASLLARTEDRFGQSAQHRYEILLITALRDITNKPDRAGSVDRPEVGPWIRSYHLRHSRERASALGGIVRQPRHLLLYRTVIPGIIGIGRVLHDAMELERHLPADYGDK